MNRLFIYTLVAQSIIHVGISQAQPIVFNTAVYRVDSYTSSEGLTYPEGTPGNGNLVTSNMFDDGWIQSVSNSTTTFNLDGVNTSLDLYADADAYLVYDPTFQYFNHVNMPIEMNARTLLVGDTPPASHTAVAWTDVTLNFSVNQLVDFRLDGGFYVYDSALPPMTNDYASTDFRKLYDATTSTNTNIVLIDEIQEYDTQGQIWWSYMLEPGEYELKMTLSVDSNIDYNEVTEEFILDSSSSGSIANYAAITMTPFTAYSSIDTDFSDGTHPFAGESAYGANDPSIEVIEDTADSSNKVLRMNAIDYDDENDAFIYVDQPGSYYVEFDLSSTEDLWIRDGNYFGVPDVAVIPSTGGVFSKVSFVATADQLGSIFDNDESIRRISFHTREGEATVFLIDNLIIREYNSLTGDLDGDGFVGITDLNIVLSNWNQSIPTGDPLADPSGDGFVGIEDLNTVLGNWNAGTPPPASVPEPASVALLLIGSAALLRRSG